MSMKNLSLGATFIGKNEVLFHLWAPKHKAVQLVLKQKGKRIQFYNMQREKGGYFVLQLKDVNAGDLYQYTLTDGNSYPDPASRYQPQGVQGFSSVVDPSSYCWKNGYGKQIEQQDLIFYECHVGTFTKEGTYKSLIKRIPYLKKLGVNCIELMPLAESSGKYNWGYDGVFLFAPQHTYGSPDDLKQLIDVLHQHGMGVCLDIVYNHLGAEGNYFGHYGHYFTHKHHTLWGDALNYDDVHSEEVRRYMIENALYWIREFHIDAIRLDAIDAIVDNSQYPFLLELSHAIQEESKRIRKKIHLFAESDLNDPKFALPYKKKGYGFSGLWNDDFHHALHVTLTSEKKKYFADFNGLSDLAKALDKGFVYEGQYSTYRLKNHGKPCSDLQPQQLVICSQNHDQVGNRGDGERDSSYLSYSTYKTRALLLLLSPYIPLLFMGEEYGEKNPFLYFVDFQDKKLLEAVHKGRKNAFISQQLLNLKDKEAFEFSKLSWKRNTKAAQALLTLYQDLIRLRKKQSLIRKARKTDFTVHFDENQKWIALEYYKKGEWLGVICYLGDAPIEIVWPFQKKSRGKVLLHTDQTKYAPFMVQKIFHKGKLHFLHETGAIFVSK